MASALDLNIFLSAIFKHLQFVFLPHRDYVHNYAKLNICFIHIYA